MLRAKNAIRSVTRPAARFQTALTALHDDVAALRDNPRESTTVSVKLHLDAAATAILVSRRHVHAVETALNAQLTRLQDLDGKDQGEADDCLRNAYRELSDLDFADAREGLTTALASVRQAAGTTQRQAFHDLNSKILGAQRGGINNLSTALGNALTKIDIAL